MPYIHDAYPGLDQVIKSNNVHLNRFPVSLSPTLLRREILLIITDFIHQLGNVFFHFPVTWQAESRSDKACARLLLFASSSAWTTFRLSSAVSLSRYGFQYSFCGSQNLLKFFAIFDFLLTKVLFIWTALLSRISLRCWKRSTQQIRTIMVRITELVIELGKLTLNLFFLIGKFSILGLNGVSTHNLLCQA